MQDDPPRTREARDAAIAALVRVIHHYGGRPEFVVLGGLVPDLLCGESRFSHAGTTDVDVQVNLEIECGSINATRLEQALKRSGFEPHGEHVWRWEQHEPTRAVIKFELLADLEDQPNQAIVRFEECERLGAVNLRGTRFASLDVHQKQLKGSVDGEAVQVEVCVTGLAGFLLAKVAAALGRRKPKDWYDIAFVLMHNDAGGPTHAAERVLATFGDHLAFVRIALDDLAANFATSGAQGAVAYADQMLVDHPDLERRQLVADGVVAVDEFLRGLGRRPATS